MAAAETLNFTRAAEKSSLTQSGVSQHIAKLEANLGVSLFTRSNKSVFLTEAGRHLAIFIERYLDETDALCENLQSIETKLLGTVSYAMPGSCLFAPHLRMMLERRKRFPGISLQIQIRTNAEIIQALLRGQIDFGFITETVEIPGLKLIPFCNEEFIFVSHHPKIKLSSMADVLALDFVTFPGMEIYFDTWQRYYFPKIKKRHYDSLNLKGSVESIHGAVALAAGAVGCLVAPRQCVDSECRNGKLFISAPATPKQPLQNTIYVGSLADRSPTRRAQQVMDWFFAMHPEVGR